MFRHHCLDIPLGESVAEPARLTAGSEVIGHNGDVLVLCTVL